MTAHESFDTLPKSDESFFTIGNFDGIHLGHRALIESMVARAGMKNAPAVAVTFRESPRKLYHPGNFAGYILPMHFKRILLEQMGVDRLVCLDFPSVKDVEAGDFIGRMTERAVRAHLTVGYNFRFGKGGAGDVSFLKELAARGKIELEVAEKFVLNGEAVNSTAIREAVAAGDMDKAAKFLGRPYFLYSEKLHGDRLGRTIGFPTLNLAPNEQVLPGAGVYYSLFYYRGEFLPAMSYVGHRPTLTHHELRIEANVLGFDEHLPDGKYILLFVRKIRDEKRFKNLDELKEMLYNDRTAVSSLHGGYTVPQTIKDLLTGGHNVG